MNLSERVQIKYNLKMTISIVFTVVCCLFVVTCAWEDYVDYYEYNSLDIEVDIGSEVTLYCSTYDDNLIWKHNGQQYHPGTNSSSVHWLNDNKGTIKVTVLSVNEEGIWDCFSYDSIIVTYELLLKPKDPLWKNRIFQNMEQTSTDGVHIITTETPITTERINKSSDVFYPVTTSKNVKLQSKEIEEEITGNAFNAFLDSLRNPFVRTNKEMVISGVNHSSASFIVVFGIFIVNLFIV